MKTRFSFRSIGKVMLLIVLAGITVPAYQTDGSQARADTLDWQTVIPDLPTRIWRSSQPADDLVLYVTTGQDLRRSLDQGDSWERLYPQPPLSEVEGISSMTFDPTTANMPALFVARNPSGDAAGVQRSTNDGLTWENIFSLDEGILRDLAAARARDGQLHVFAVGGAHIWRSTNGGDSWAADEAGLPTGSDLYKVYASPAYADDQTLYLVAFGALLRSTDGGDNWAKVNIPWLNSPREVVFSPQYQTDGTLWISYFWVEGHGEYPPNGVARSTDFGQTWEMANEGLPVNYLDGWIMGLDASPDYSADHTLYAVERIMDGTWQVYRSQDGGDLWEWQGAAAQVFPNRLLLATPDRLFLSSQSGLYRLDLVSEHWSYLPIIFQNQRFYSPPAGPLMIEGQAVNLLIGHPQSETIYALTEAGLYRSDDGARAWTLMNTAPPTTESILLAPSQPEILFAGAGYPCYQGGPDVMMFKSIDSGRSWEEAPAGLNLQPLAINPSDPDRIYARGCDGPWLSTDGGEYWNRQGDALFNTYNVRQIAPAPSDDWQTVYLGCATEGGGGAIIASTRYGTQWQRLTPGDPSPWYVQTLAVDPLAAQNVYFGEPNGFWSSQDGGETWYTSIDGLEDVVYDPADPAPQSYGLLSLAYQPGNLDQWLLGTVGGLYRSIDRGLSWSKVSGPEWLEGELDALLLREAEPDKLFVTTLGGVYVFYP